MYELLKKDGMAKRGRFHTVHGNDRDAGFYERRNGGGNLREPYQQMISVRLKRRLNCQIHITFMSDRGMKS